MTTGWTLAHPALLLLAPLALLALAASARRSAAPISGWRRMLSTLVRACAVLLLILSMVGPTALRRGEQPYLTVFLADVSESVPRDAWERALPDLRSAWDREIAAGNRCALVAFAGGAEVLVPPGLAPLPADLSRLAHRAETDRLAAAGEGASERLAALRAWTDAIRARSTDFSVGIAVARSLFQEGSTPRIVLLTDGRSPLRPARDLELPPGSSLVRLAGAPRQDVAVVDVSAPTGIRAGEPFDVRVLLNTTAPGKVSIRLSVDDGRNPETEQVFAAPSAGEHLVILKNLQQQRSFTPGLRRIHVLAQAADDADPRNNLGAAALTVTGKPKVLLVEGTPAAGEALARILQAQDIEWVREPAARLAERSTLEDFVAVILAGVPREAIPPTAVGSLTTYVTESGGGLWVVGGAALRGDHGYAKSPLEKILPVTFSAEASPAAASGPDPAARRDPPPPPPPPDPNAGVPKTVVSPTLAMLLLVDKSGSMAGDPIALVKEACVASAQLLTPKDFIGVMAFDVKPRWILPFTEADRQQFIETSIRRLYADGGTHILPAMVDALRAFKTDARARSCAVKHVILFSDGDTVPADFETVTRKMAEEGVTVTTVCVGAGPSFDAPLMSRIAEWGKGRFIFTDSFRRVPKIFAQVTQETLAIVPRGEKPPPAVPDPKPATPDPVPPPPPPPSSGPVKIGVQVRDPHEVLQGLAVAALPPLGGILDSARKPGKVELPLVTTAGQPVLALWRVGLGKVAVWTSDLSGAWGAEWIAWKDAGKLFPQLVRHVTSTAPDAELAGRVSIRLQGSDAVLRIEAGAVGERLTVRDAVTMQDLPLQPASEGGLTLRLPLDRPGELRRLLLDRGDGRQLTVGALRAYEREFSPAGPGGDLFAGSSAPRDWKELERSLAGPRIPGEQRVDLSIWAILAALALLPLDVALRRFVA